MTEYDPNPSGPIKGRGTSDNPANRFEGYYADADPELIDEWRDPSGPTLYYRDTTRTIITSNNSPDVGFDKSINPYRGCEHGCVYCYARPTHEYFGLSAGLDFETKIFVKDRAPELLRKELMKPSYKPDVLVMSGVTDPYQPVERKARITRGCLEVLQEFRHPVLIITKNSLVKRDVDILKRIHAYEGCAVYFGLTTLDRSVAQRMEPRAVAPEEKLRAMEVLSKVGIPVGVLLAPIVPAITDHEIPSLLQAAYDHGARFAGYVILRLPYGIKDLFAQWLEHHFPERKDKVLNRVKDLREGRLNQTEYFQRMKGSGAYADYVNQMFRIHARKVGMNRRAPRIGVESFQRPDKQYQLFSG